jgi:hypothetical protein
MGTLPALPRPMAHCIPDRGLTHSSGSGPRGTVLESRAPLKLPKPSRGGPKRHQTRQLRPRRPQAAKFVSSSSCSRTLGNGSPHPSSRALQRRARSRRRSETLSQRRCADCCVGGPCNATSREGRLDIGRSRRFYASSCSPRNSPRWQWLSQESGLRVRAPCGRSGGRARQPAVQGRSLPGLRTAQMWVIRSPATSNANTVTVTPSC